MPEACLKCQEFALAIQAIFKKGLHISQTSCDFIFSTFSISSIHDLKALLTDTSNCESDSLVELIYFPDESIQLRLEDQIEATVFLQEDQDTILEYVLSCQGKTLVHVEGLQAVLTIKTLENGARAFLARLNIARQIDPELIQLVHTTSGEKQGRKYKVWLRNMVMNLRERDNFFIKNLFLKMAPRTRAFDEYLFFSLRFLEESRDEPDLMQSLTQHKHRCLRHLQQNDRLEAYRRDHNMETLMAHGIRIPHMDRQALLHQVGLVDDIGLALFDRSM
jgi:hypothetical protein